MENDIFKGSWICPEEFSAEKETCEQNFFADVYKDFYCPHTAEKVWAKISADDYYHLYIGGEFAAKGPAPAYVFAYNYNEIDLTPYIKKGKINEIRVRLYYQGLINRVRVSGDGNCGMIFDLYCDGEIILSSDESWIYEKDCTFLPSSILGYDTQFSENRDLRIPPEKKKKMRLKENIYTFEKEAFPLLECYTLSPDKTEAKENRIFFDFGKERTGTMLISAKAETDGEKITLRLAEELDEKGRPLYDMRCGCRYEDTYILKKGDNFIEQFDTKAFRFGEIIAGNNCSVTDIKMRVCHYPFPKKKFAFEKKERELDKILSLCKDTLKYGIGETITDCPTREKGQYLGDVTVAGFAHLYLTEDPRLLKKALKNFTESYICCGEFLAVSPCSYKQKIADYTLQFPLNVWRYYLYTKDRQFLSQMLPYCEKIKEIFRQYERHDGLLEKVTEGWNLVDWPDNLRDGYDFELCDPVGEGVHNVINAFYIGSVIYTEKIKAELGIAFENQSDRLKESFNNVFLCKETGLYKDSESTDHCALHSNALPVFFGIHKEEHKDALSSFLLKKGLSCGVYFSYFYLCALCRLGKNRQVTEIICGDGERGWLNMLKEGATACFEAWGKEQKWNTSLCHPWATAPVAVLKENENILPCQQHNNMF